MPPTVPASAPVGVGEARRVERQALAALGQHALDLHQRRAGARGDHELAGRVVDDAGVAAHVQRRGVGDHAGHRLLGAAAADAQDGLGGGRLADALGQADQGVVHLRRSESFQLGEGEHAALDVHAAVFGAARAAWG